MGCWFRSGRTRAFGDRDYTLTDLALLETKARLKAQLARMKASAPPWTPHDGPQREFYESDCEEILYGGAAGGGKSMSAVALPMPWIKNRDLRVLVLRRRSVDLDDLIDKAKKIYRDGDLASPRPYCAAAPGTIFVASPAHTASFPSGGRVRFDHCQNIDDWEKYQGQEYSIIVFEELTQFLEKQYLEVKSRLRSSSPGLPRKVRATTNPGGRGAEWVFKRWRFWLDPEAVIPGREPRFAADGKRLPPAHPGEILWIRRASDGSDIVSDAEDKNASSRTFIPARLRDNPSLLATDPNYAVRLRDNDPIRARQLEEGDWLAKPAAGLYFKREWVGEELVDAPTDTIWVRAWDLAATEPTISNPDPDWTVGVKLGRSFKTGLFYFGGAERAQVGPGGVRALVKETAKNDGPTIPVVLPQDPGQAGKDQAASYAADLVGYRVFSRPVTGAKEVRYGPFSTQASPHSTGGSIGRVRVCKGAKNVTAWLSVNEAFDGLGIEHDDDADATSDAFNYLAGRQGPPTAKLPPVHTRTFGSSGMAF